jgi:hypothetical protein
MAEQKTSMWLRIGEIVAGLIVLVLGGYAIVYPGATAAVLISFLAVALFIVSGIEFVRVFSEGISGWRRLLNAGLSIIALLLAIAVLVYPIVVGGVALGWLVALALIRWFRGSLTRHSGDDHRRHNRGNTRNCRAFQSYLRRHRGSRFNRDSPDHIRVRVGSIRPLRKMDVTHPPSFFFWIPISATEKGEHGTRA